MKCVNCGASELGVDRTYRYGKSGFREKFPELDIRRCNLCGLRQVDHDVIEFDKLTAYYSTGYRPGSHKKNRANSGNVKFVARGKAFSHIAGKYVKNAKAIRSVFEFGAGLGYNLIAMKQVFPNARFFTNELDESVDLPPYVERATITPDTFDIILLSHVVEHLLHPAHVCQSLASALKPNGLMIVEVPNDTERFLNAKPEDQPHVTFFEMATLTEFFERHLPGMEILKVTTSGPKFSATSSNASGRPTSISSKLNRSNRTMRALFFALRKAYTPIRHIRLYKSIASELKKLLEESDDGARAQLRLIARRRA